MNFLKCKNCGYENPINSEYLTFCGHCNKKLENNFREWQLSHSDKSFEDYQSIVGVLGSAGDNVPNKRKKSEKKLNFQHGLLIGVISTFLLLIILWVSLKPDRNRIKSQNQSQIENKTINKADDWVESNSEEGKYSISFPKTPTERISQVETIFGPIAMKFKGYQDNTGIDDNLMYGVSFMDYPSDKISSEKLDSLKISEFFTNSINGTMQAIQGSNLVVEIIKFKNYPGRKFRMSLKNGMVLYVSQIYLVKNRVYMLQVITKVDNSFNNSINKFLNSFELIE